MVNLKPATLACLAPVLALVSCAAPKAVVVDQEPVKKKEPVAEASVPEPVMPGDPYDGLRVNEDAMLALPGDGDFRSSVPAPPRTGAESGAVIARPPTEPPPRPKPQEGQ